MKIYKRSIKYLLIILAFAAAGHAQQAPVISSNVEVISIVDGPIQKNNGWRLAPEANPDVYEAQLIDGKPHKVTFRTDVDSISFDVELGKSYDFIVKYGDKLCHTRIVGTKFVPAARFDARYRQHHRGKISVSVPEAYELVNIAIAVTPTAIAENGLVYQKSDYYRRMRAWFDKHNSHPLIASLEAELKKNSNRYFTLKMNGYAFEFDRKGELVRSSTFDRTGFDGERANSLLPYFDQLRDFAKVSNFREFFKENKKLYKVQVRFYRETADLAGMKQWLDRNLPASNDYDHYNIVFSPLVAYNQSVTWFDDDGFKELQPHVNFPYPEDLKRPGRVLELSAQAAVIFRGNIVFTEMNHGYINPEADKYGERIFKAVSNRHLWVDKKMGADYYPGIAAFNEYMNWALVNLRAADLAPKEDQPKMIAAVERMMTEGRGFPKFAEFDRFLIDLYVNRKPGQTLADLYPQIIEWFEKENAKAD
jgi:hypothetical protein